MEASRDADSVTISNSKGLTRQMIPTRRCSCQTRSQGSSQLFPSLISPTKGKNWSRSRRQKPDWASACRTPQPSFCFSLKNPGAWPNLSDLHFKNSMWMTGSSLDRASSSLPNWCPATKELRKRPQRVMYSQKYYKRGGIIRRRSCIGGSWGIQGSQMGRECPLVMMLRLIRTGSPRN